MFKALEIPFSFTLTIFFFWAWHSLVCIFWLFAGFMVDHLDICTVARILQFAFSWLGHACHSLHELAILLVSISLHSLFGLGRNSCTGRLITERYGVAVPARILSHSFALHTIHGFFLSLHLHTVLCLHTISHVFLFLHLLALLLV